MVAKNFDSSPLKKHFIMLIQFTGGPQARTPIHHAVQGGLENTVTSLLSHGANVFLMNNDHQTALDVARAQGYNNVVRAIEDTMPRIILDLWNATLEDTDFNVRYPSSTESNTTDLSAKSSASEKKEGGSGGSSSCVICLDAPAEGTCSPCGHVARCMSCIDEIKSKNWGCCYPICRTKIDQVIRLYHV